MNVFWVGMKKSESRGELRQRDKMAVVEVSEEEVSEEEESGSEEEESGSEEEVSSSGEEVEVGRSVPVCSIVIVQVNAFRIVSTCICSCD